MAARRQIALSGPSAKPGPAPERAPDLGPETAPPAPSPARELQDQLSAEWGRERRWSPRSTFLFITATSGAAWALAALAVARLLG